MLSRITFFVFIATLAIAACSARPTISPSITDVRLGQQSDPAPVPAQDEGDAGDDEGDDEKVPTEKVTIVNPEGEEVEFKLELAVNDAQRAKGLMERKEIKEHGGMLFIYPRAGYRSFWMANCLVDIDIIFLDPKGRITAVHEAKAERPRQPGESLIAYEDRLERYPSRRPAQFVIELKSGWIEKLGVKPGQAIDLEVDRLEKLAEEDDFGYW